MKIWAYFLLALAMTGCSVYDGHFHQRAGTFDPSPSNNYFGKIAYEPGADYISFMRGKCAAYGGLISDSVQSSSTKEAGSHFGLLKEYKCRGESNSQSNKIVSPVNTQHDEVKKLQAEVSRLQELEKAKQEPIQADIVIKNVAPQSERLSIEASKKKCTELGFKPATEGHGKCVLQLSK